MEINAIQSVNLDPGRACMWAGMLPKFAHNFPQNYQEYFTNQHTIFYIFLILSYHIGNTKNEMQEKFQY